MISDKMTKALNGQINRELYSAYLYLSMSAYSSYKGLAGAANWCYVQAKEEMFHVQKLFDYLNDHGSCVVLDAVDKPPTEFGTLPETFEAVLKHEQSVTACINELTGVATGEGDHATETFLQWFVTEQTEEEKSAKDILDRLRLAGDTGPAVLMIDSELAARVFTMPTV